MFDILYLYESSLALFPWKSICFAKVPGKMVYFFVPSRISFMLL